MGAEIVAIGNELLLGETVDTNSAHVARCLGRIGVRVHRTTVVGDDRERLRAVLEEVRDRSRLVITMGGLGPTHDDITREVVAEVFDRRLLLDERLLSTLEERFRRFGYEMPPANRSQAEIPEGARVIPNPHGTAPGLIIDDERTTVYVLPGVPVEMKALLDDAVLPEILAATDQREPAIQSRVVRTVGIGESALAEELADLVSEAAPLEVAFLPHLGRVDVRVTAAGLPATEAETRLVELTSAIADRAGRWYYGEDETTLPVAILEQLRDRGWTVAVAESCTGGGLGAALTEAPGSSDVFLGGIVAYANHVKTSTLGVSPVLLEEHGAVSETVCRSMAAAIRTRFGAAVGCAITGIAGPGGGTPEKPVGLVYCGVETPLGSKIRRLDYPGSRDAVRERATLSTMGLLLSMTRAGNRSAEGAP
ncbi:MAG: competence/damage-inducible protein A [Gemmatimonadetes bacterium]|nr:competence/damage-inducible protein A [Gemmatimonadota bacterium]